MRGLIQRRDLILLGLGIVLGSVLILSSNPVLAQVVNKFTLFQKTGRIIIEYSCTELPNVINLK